MDSPTCGACSELEGQAGLPRPPPPPPHLGPLLLPPPLLPPGGFSEGPSEQEGPLQSLPQPPGPSQALSAQRIHCPLGFIFSSSFSRPTRTWVSR